MVNRYPQILTDIQKYCQLQGDVELGQIDILVHVLFSTCLERKQSMFLVWLLIQIDDANIHPRVFSIVTFFHCSAYCFDHSFSCEVLMNLLDHHHHRHHHHEYHQCHHHHHHHHHHRRHHLMIFNRFQCPGLCLVTVQN